MNLRASLARLMLLLAVTLLSSPQPAGAAAPVRVEILYMNHGPMQPTIRALREVFARQGEAVRVNWHDFDSPDGTAFLRAKKLSGHIPLAIWLNDRDSAMLQGREIRFRGFPTGAGPAAFQGGWRVDELERVLEQLRGSEPRNTK